MQLPARAGEMIPAFDIVSPADKSHASTPLVEVRLKVDVPEISVTEKLTKRPGKKCKMR
jgi:hypothetical protein